MRSSIIPKFGISAAYFSLLTACSNFSPTLKSFQSETLHNQHSTQSISSLLGTLGKEALIVKSDYYSLKKFESGNELAQIYLQIVSGNPQPVVITTLASIIRSETFLNSNSDDKVAILEILSSGLTKERAHRFKKCFALDKCFEILHSKDLFNQELIDNLRNLATKPIHKNLESQRGAMIAALLEYACDLRPLDQGDTNGCGPIACLIALDNKSEIVRLVQGLCSPAGEVRLVSGNIMHRSASSLSVAGDNEQGIAIRILADAVSNYANGPFFTYSSAFEINQIGIVGFPGMLSPWAQKAINDLTGRSHQLLQGEKLKIQTINDSLNKTGYAIVLRVATLTDWHWIVLKKIDAEWVHFQDPNGTSYSLSLEEVSVKKEKKTKPVKQKIHKKSRAEINFPEQPEGPPLKAIYKVPVSALENCMKAAIVVSD